TDVVEEHGVAVVVLRLVVAGLRLAPEERADGVLEVPEGGRWSVRAGVLHPTALRAVEAHEVARMHFDAGPFRTESAGEAALPHVGRFDDVVIGAHDQGEG